jgi:FKBP-type peptidyl-prolyl cis-trans isomerase SlpA
MKRIGQIILAGLLSTAITGTSLAEGIRIAELGDSISIRFTLKESETGKLVTQTPNEAPFTFVVGQKRVVPGLEEFLIGKAEGFTGEVTVAPDKAFGIRNEKKIVSVERDKLPPQALAPGVFVDTKNPKTGEVRRGQVLKLDQKEVTLDFNHPMAGKSLKYDVSIVQIAKAETSDKDSGKTTSL